MQSKKDESSKIIPGSWKNKIVASCLQEERDKKDFTVGETEIVDTLLDKEYYQRYFDSQQLMMSDPILRNKHTFYEMDRDEMYYRSM